MGFPDRIERTVGDRSEDAHRKAYDGNAESWATELAELAGYLDAA